jgi:protein-tyrosine sulfotransferase
MTDLQQPAHRPAAQQPAGEEPFAQSRRPVGSGSPPNQLQRLATKVRNRLGRLQAYRWRQAPGGSQEPVIIIGGCPRSGTTLLRRLLDEHPNIVCGPETSALLPVRLSAGELAAASDLPRADVAAMLAASRSQADFVDQLFDTVARRHGKRRWAEKTPLNVRHLDWIFRHFPNARFIHVIRDGRDVACSLRTHPVRRLVNGAWVSVPQRRSVASCIDQWLDLTARGLRWRGDPRYMEVRYEDLVAAPETTMRRVMDFVGEPYEEAWLQARLAEAGGGPSAPGSAAPAGADGRPDPERPNAAGRITSGSIGRWRRDLSPPEIDLVRARATDRLIELAYETRTDWS